MNKYYVSRNFENIDNEWSCYKNDDLILENVSYADMMEFQRGALDELIENGFIDEDVSYDTLGDRVYFNQLFEDLTSED